MGILTPPPQPQEWRVWQQVRQQQLTPYQENTEVQDQALRLVSQEVGVERIVRGLLRRIQSENVRVGETVEGMVVGIGQRDWDVKRHG